MANMEGGTEGANVELPLENTPTWIVSCVCFVMVIISLVLERLLHAIGTYLKKKSNRKLLHMALQKVKQEVLLLGFSSLLLTTASEKVVSNICIPESLLRHMLPCRKKIPHIQKTSHFFLGIWSSRRRLLSLDGDKCASKGKVPLLSLDALQKLDTFIFVLAIVHVVLCLLTMVLGEAKIHQWKHWEDSIQMQKYDTDMVLKSKVTHVHQHAFITDHSLGIGRVSNILKWLHSFIKQFYGSVTKSDYITLRLGFIYTHCRGNPKFNFYRYMLRTLEADFMQVAGIGWYHWIFVVIFLLLNVDGWHAYFWISFIPLVLLLALGTKLEHVTTQMAHEVAENHTAIEGELIVKPSDDLFWFHRPRIVRHLIHFVFFQNAFEIAFFIWILTAGLDSCIMGQMGYIVPRLVIGVIIRLLCSYSTLPLYTIMSQMGSKFKKGIFSEHVQEGLVAWARYARKVTKQRKELKDATSCSQGPNFDLRKPFTSRLLRTLSTEFLTDESSSEEIQLDESSSEEIQLQQVRAMEKGAAMPSQPSTSAFV